MNQKMPVNVTQEFIAALAIAIASMPATAGGPSEAIRASIDASVGVPANVIHGSAQLFRDAGRFTVTGVKTVGDASTLGLRSLATGAEASVQFTARGIEASALATGTVLDASVSATGVLLVAAGKALVFVPNEVGRSLLHHSRAAER
jgi:hypothetical protein